MQLDSIFNPSSIAVVGVSRNPNSIGRMLLKNIISFGYTGCIYPIHPKISELDGIKVFKSLTEVPEDIDLVISIIKRDHVLKLLEDAENKGVKGMIIITAGFKEIDAEGEELEKKVAEKARNARIRVIGPNSMGIINGYGLKVNASFTPITPSSGGISFISQSGAIGAVFTVYANKYGLGYSKFASVGNKMDINITDLLPYFEQDTNTRVITCYLESFSDPENLIRIASKITRSKPIIMVKSGRTDRGSVAASSHTGALASSETMVNSILQKTGVIRVDSIKELVEASQIFLKTSLPRGKRVAVISNAGGPGTIATDALINNGLLVEDPSPEIKDILKSFLPLEASVENPIDILPSAGIEGYKKTVETVLRDQNIDMALVIMLPPVLTTIEDLFYAINEVAKNSHKPIIATFMGDNGDISKYPDLNYPIFEYPETAAKMMGKLADYSEWKDKNYKFEKIKVSEENIKKVNNIISIAHESNELLSQDEIEEIFTLYGFEMPISRIISKKENLRDACMEIKFPVVLKIASKHISHKSDSGGVIINIQNYEQAVIAYDKIMKIYEAHNLPLLDRQVLIQRFYVGGIEIALGATSDHQFGHMVMVGSGGTLIEIINDVVFSPAPVGILEAGEMLEKLQGYKLMTGFRGSKPIDLEIVKDYICRISTLLLNHPEIKELDINPLYALPKGKKSVVVDVRMSLKEN